jgi:hypothetical protein
VTTLNGDEGRLRAALCGQSLYFILTGAWALVHRRSFEAVAGRKQDYWLVQVVSTLVIVIGLVLVDAGRRNRVSREAIALSVGSAGALAAVETVHALRRRISAIYLVDAVLECVFIGAVLRSAHNEAPQ